MALAALSTRFQSFTLIPTIKLGPSGAGSQLGGPVHTLGPCGSLQDLSCEAGSLPQGLPPPPRAFSIRGLRLYFPELEPWVVWSTSLPAIHPVYLCANVGPPGATHCYACPILRHPESGPLCLSVRECGAAGSASAWTACPVHPTLRQSRSRHSLCESSPPRCLSPPLLPVWMNVYFLFPWCRTPLPFDFLSVLVVRGGAVCLPTPPSWFSLFLFLKQTL